MNRWFCEATRVVIWKGAVVCLQLSVGASAQSVDSYKAGQAEKSSFDCTEIKLEYEPDPTLTPEENLERMDAAFYRSLTQFDACQETKQAAANANPSGGGGGASGGGSAGLSGTESESDSAFSDSVASQPSSDMSGTEVVATQENAAASQGSASADTDTNMGANNQPMALSNGKLPEDIPPADNDSVLEAQIRQAAINETDPAVKKRLWNEYRKYKGLPPVKEGESQ